MELKDIWSALEQTKSRNMILSAGFCILFGFGAKAGAFPLHIWLPKAHPVAPAPASALLSGMLTKTGIFGILILSFNMFGAYLRWGKLILMIGVCTMFLGAFLALFSIDMKKTLALSSVSQIGFILTGIGVGVLLGEENALALSGSILHMVNHSLLKLLLFMLAGVVYMNTHALDFNAIQGFGRKKPYLALLYICGYFGIGGIPLFNGYISKTLLHEAILEANLPAIEIVFLISGGFTLAYMTKIFVCLFVEKNADSAIQEKYDSMRNYMKPLSRISLGICAIILPILGSFPHRTLDRLAAFSMEIFTHAHSHTVHYFDWVNLKGGMISIGIGLFVYFAVIRLLMMEINADIHKYIDRWPRFLDLENLIYRPLLLSVIPFVEGIICRNLDSLADMLVVFTRKTWLKDSPIHVERQEGTIFTDIAGSIANTCHSLFSALFEKEEPKVDYKHVYAMKHEETMENTFIISRSLSFGLLLFCVGLVITVIYIFGRYFK